MAQPSTVDTAFVLQYGSAVYHLTQQKGSKFAGKVRNESVKGESKAFERLGLATVEEVASRHPDTPLNEIPHTRRWVTPVDYHTATLLDHQDLLKMMINPKGDYAQAQANAIGREIDDVIIAASLGDAAAGVSPTTATVTFEDDSISINGDGTATTLGTLAAVTTVANISLEKMLLMLRIFNDEDTDPDETRYWVVSPKDLQDMLNLTEIGSADYNTVKTLVAGKVDTFSGFTWFWSTRLTLDAATSTGRRTFAWCPSGIIYGSGEGVSSRITERDDKSYAWQIYSKVNCGAVRLEGAKVHECLNKLT